MSHKPYYKEASKSKSVSEKDENPQEINRFSDIEEIDKRRHDVLDYMVLGYEPEEIAEFMDIELHTVENDYKAIVKQGFEARDEDIEQVRDEIMRTYRLVKKEGYKAFRMSQGTTEKITEESGSGGKNGEYEKDKVVTEEKAGDPRFLSLMVDAAKEMGKVSGAQKHKEVEIAQQINQNSVNILSPQRTKMPGEFDRWTKKPDDKQIPDGREVDMENL